MVSIFLTNLLFLEKVLRNTTACRDRSNAVIKPPSAVLIRDDEIEWHNRNGSAVRRRTSRSTDESDHEHYNRWDEIQEPLKILDRIWHFISFLDFTDFCKRRNKFWSPRLSFVAHHICPMGVIVDRGLRVKDYRLLLSVINSSHQIAPLVEWIAEKDKLSDVS